MAKKLKIVSISSEIAPFSKTGGLADVARSLPKALRRLGHEIIAITPLYGQAIKPKEYDLKIIFENVKVILNSEESVIVNYWKGYLMDGLPVYFVENKKYFSKRKSIYGSDHENARFLVFDVAALKLVSLLKFEADIVHCHDWQTGLIPYYLKTDFRYSKTLSHAKTIFTIHNLVFQFGHNWWEIAAEKKDFGRSRIPHLSNPEIENINFAKRAIHSADLINTVSEQYRDEIMTKNFGQDLERILRNREDRVFGIVNGIDYNAYNPSKDKSLYKNYDHSSVYRKSVNKEFLQKKLGLPVDGRIPMLTSTSRVTFQKGFELIVSLLDHFVKLDIQFVILGDGDKEYIKKLKQYQKKYPKKIIWLPFSENKNLETLIYAASDMFLLPSHHEPCGINQLIAMRYGCVPIVRKVGGLHNTVEAHKPGKSRGTGFSFKGFNEISFYTAFVRAFETFKYKDVWKELVVRGMKGSNSWEIPAKKYVELYKKALRLKGNGIKK